MITAHTNANPDVPAENSPLSLNVCITSGGTRVPIDSVRSITNESQGTTGALIAETALQRGHRVHYVHARGARVPFERDLTLDPAKSKEAELARLSLAYDEYSKHSDRLTSERVNTFDAYHRCVNAVCKERDAEVLILTMAASDYGPRAVEGKLPSSDSTLDLSLAKLPKIISEVKRDAPHMYLVGFKLLQNAPPDQLVETAYRQMLRDKQDLVVANVGYNSMDPRALTTFIITPERGVIPVTREELPHALLDLIEQRYSSAHLRTVREDGPGTRDASRLAAFTNEVRECAALALFPSYYDGARAEFGFVARRDAAGTLITGRGTSKSAADTDAIALIRDVDLAARTVKIDPEGPKAALNGALAHLIFRERPEVNFIVHVHVDLPEAIMARVHTSPGTLEDWAAIREIVRSGAQIIGQPSHGVIILLEDPGQLVPLLMRNGLYAHDGAAYDDAYQRFLRSDGLIDRLCANLPHDAQILDLAAGTGEVSRELARRGYSDIELRDRSPGMLARAEEKLARVLPTARFRVEELEALDERERFDAVVLRQAVNYVRPDELTEVFRRVHAALKPGGRFAFNSFVPGEEGSSRRVTRSEAGGAIVANFEANTVRGGLVTHSQRSEVFTADGGYRLHFDVNRFHQVLPETFETALRAAGFANVTVERSGASVYFMADKERI